MSKPIPDQDYGAWLHEVKTKIRSVQIKAALTVNRELLQFYWQLGAEIVEKQEKAQWGEGFLPRLSRDLMAEFPDIKGFSKRNLIYIRKWYLFYNQGFTIVQQAVAQLPATVSEPAEKPLVSNTARDVEEAAEKVQQVVAQITAIPWGHNIAIVSKCNTTEKALFYVQQTLEHGWSRSVLVHQIETGLFHRKGKAVTNFARTLPAPQSDLAREVLKDPYVFDFLTMAEDYSERELEKGLIDHIAKFLLELGAGFAYIGRQYPLTVGERDFALDLLFYHTRLHCYVVIELKTTDFEPEHAGKLNFYLKAVDEQLRKEGDAPTMGILLCKNKDRLVAEYALSDIHKPLGVSEYQLTQALPEELRADLPSVEEIERELADE